MKKALVNRDYCVACGCCLKVCKRGAITVENGVCAVCVWLLQYNAYFNDIGVCYYGSF